MMALGAFYLGPINKKWLCDFQPHLMTKVLPKKFPTVFKKGS